MRRSLLSLLAVLSLITPGRLVAQTPAVASDPDVLKGMKAVDEGDYDAAIFTLDAAARRLAADPSKTRDMSQAYLYLGIAYMGKGHEAAAKAKFREALTQIKDLTLSPDKFPPKVIDAFEAAKQESAQAATAASSASAAAAPAAGKKKGGSKGLLIGVGVAAVGGGIAVAAGGGGGGSSTSAPTDTRTVFTATGTTTQYNCFQPFRLVPTKSGTLDASLTWTDTAAVAELQMYLSDNNGNEVAKSNAASNLEQRLSSSVTNQIYDILVCQHGYENPVNFSLTVRYP